MKFWKLASATTALILSTSVNAALIDNGNITTDTETGLDWLDITESTNLSYNYVSSQFGVGGQFEGWRYANTNDMRDYLNHAGWAIPEYDLWIEQNEHYSLGDQNSIDLINLMGGATWFDGSYQNSVFVMDFDLPNYGDNSVLVSYLFQAPSVFVVADQATLGVDESYNEVGHVLVRASVVPVPVPAAVWLFGSGLVGLVGFARRKKA